MVIEASEAPGGMGAGMSWSRCKACVLAVWLVLLVGLSGVAAQRAISLVDQPFNGFFVQSLAYVSPFQLPGGLGASGLEVVDPILRIDGRPVRDAADFMRQARDVPVGTTLRYEVLRQGQVRQAEMRTRLFTWEDLGASFGLFLALGWEFSLIGLGLFWLRPDQPAARALSLTLALWGLMMVVYFDFNAGASLAPLMFLVYPLAGSGFMALAMVFPGRWRFSLRHPWLLWLPWALGGALSLGMLLFDRGPGPAMVPPAQYAVLYALRFVANTWIMLGIVAVLLAIAARLIGQPRGSRVRRQAAIALTGLVLGFVPSAVWAFGLNLGPHPLIPLSVAIWSMAAFPLAIAYAIVSAGLFDIRLALRNSMLYGLLSAWLAGAYVLAATALRALGGQSPDLLHELGATAVVVVLFVPARDRLQALIDRRLFRERYDAQRALEEASRDMAALLDPEAIARRLIALADGTLHASWGAVLLRCDEGPDGLHMRTWGETPPGSVVGATDWTSLSDPETALGERLGAEVVIPLRFEGRCVGLWALGPLRSAQPYGERDLRLLKTLANQSAVALENAMAYGRLHRLSQELERKVAERTRELEAAYGELKSAQVKLVHSERMAALGQLVAGVAHELNNPISFVYGSVELMEQRLGDVRRVLAAERAGAPAEAIARLRAEVDLDGSLEELDALLATAREGAERVTAIVKNLRNFSRLEEYEPGPVDVAACLESSLALVAAGFKQRVTFHRDIAPVGELSGSAGHLSQVFMNLLVNAAQAIEGPGDVWVSLREEADAALVEIRDSGCGMDAETRRRIFEPFFTTKPPGEGTGLGLAICHGIVSQHEGRIEVESEPGAGTRFSLRLPLARKELRHADCSRGG